MAGWQDAPIVGAAPQAAPPVMPQGGQPQPAWAGAPVVPATPPPAPMPQASPVAQAMGVNPAAMTTTPEGQNQIEIMPELHQNMDNLRALQDKIRLPGMVGDVQHGMTEAGNYLLESLLGGGVGEAKGIRDLGAGVASLPFDIAGTVSPAAGELAQDIRETIPQIKTDSLPQDIIGAMTQYALPAAAGAKVIGGLTEAAPPIVSFITKLLGAAAGDVAATDPDQATTIGSMLPGDFGKGPTAIQADDGPMEKRLKVGAETIPVGAAIEGAVKGVSKVAKPLEPAMQNLTDDGRKLLTGERLAKAGVPEDVGAQAAPLAQDGYKPITSDVVNTPEAQGIARGVINSPEGAPLVSRVKENEQAISNSVDQALQPQPGVSAGAASTEFKAQGANAVAAPTRRVDDIKAQQSVASADLADAEGKVAANAGVRADASESLANLIEQEKSGATAVKNGLYDKAKDLGKAVPVDAGKLAGIAGTVRSDIGPLAQQDPILNGILGDLDRLAPTGAVDTGLLDAAGKPITRAADTVPITLADLIDLQPRLSRAIDGATGKVRGDIVEHLKDLRDGIKAQINTLSEGGSPAALALKEAETNFKTNFAPKFRDGTGKALDMAERTGSPVPPTAQAGKFLKTNTASGAREAVADLNRIFETSESKPAARKAARDYMVGLMADEMKGNTNAVKAQQFIAKYGEAIDGVPGLRTEMQQMANRLKSGSAKTAALDEELKAAEAERVGAETEFKRSDAGLWVDGNVADVVNGAISDPAKMDALLKQAGKDPSGAALADVKNQIKEKLNDMIRNDGSQTAGGVKQAGSNDAKALQNKDVVVSLAKANNLLKEGTPERASLEKAVGPDGMKKLDLYRKQLELSSRISNMRGTKNSDTTLNVLSAAQSGAGVTKGAIVSSMVVRIVRFLDEHSVNSIAKKAKIMTDALTDPDLAGTLVMQYNESTAKVVERKLSAYLANNVLSDGTDDEQPKAEKAKKPAN